MLEYQMDLQPGSYSYTPTLDDFAKSFPFYCVESGKYVTRDAYYTKRDHRDCYLLMVTIEGCGKMTWKNQNCLLEKGSAVLIDCNSYQEYATVPGETWSFFYLHFNALSMEGYKNALLAGLTPVRLRTPGYGAQLMEEICQNSYRTDILAYAAQSSGISNLLTEMLCSLADDRTAPSPLYRTDIADLAEYIRRNCTKDLHIQDFTDYSNLSKHYLIRLFGRQTGMSPYQYLHMCRINRAQMLLRSTDMTVAQIADAVGYSDPVVLIRHFRSFHQMTPGEYRKESIILLTGTNDIIKLST